MRSVRIKDSQIFETKCFYLPEKAENIQTSDLPFLRKLFTYVPFVKFLKGTSFDILSKNEDFIMLKLDGNEAILKDDLFLLYNENDPFYYRDLSTKNISIIFLPTNLRFISIPRNKIFEICFKNLHY